MNEVDFRVIDDIVSVISKYGKFYGGFVRDHIVPRKIYKDDLKLILKEYFYDDLYLNLSIIDIIVSYSEIDSSLVKFNDMDVWIKEYNYTFNCNTYESETIDEINKEFSSKFNNKYKITFKSRYSDYGYFCGSETYLCIDDNSTIKIDLIEHDKEALPVWDFSINTLSYDGKDLKAENYTIYDGDYHMNIVKLTQFNTEDIIKHIKDKKLFHLNFEGFINREMYNNRRDKFIKMGYSVIN